MGVAIRAAVLAFGVCAAAAGSFQAQALPMTGADLKSGGDLRLVQYWYPYGPYPYGPYPYYSVPPPPPGYYAPPPQAPPAPQATGAPPPQSWYYCDDPKGYYPQVQNCPTPWRQVTAPPPQPKKP